MATARRQTRLRGRGLGVTEDFASEAAEKSITKLGRVKKLGEEKVAAQKSVAPQVTGTGPAATVAPPATPSAPPPVTPPPPPPEPFMDQPTLVPAGPEDPFQRPLQTSPAKEAPPDPTQRSEPLVGPGPGEGTDTSGMTGFEDTAFGQTPTGQAIAKGLEVGAKGFLGATGLPGAIANVAMSDASPESLASLAVQTGSMVMPQIGMLSPLTGFLGKGGGAGPIAGPSPAGYGGAGDLGALGPAAGTVGSFGGGPPSATGDPAGLGGSGLGGGGVK